MSENNKVNNEEFGISVETSSSNAVSMSGGINKAVLVSVKAEEIGKTNKYKVLNFKFKDLEGIKSFSHTEFIPTGKATTKQTEAENYATKKGGFNSRIKHIFETYAKFPEQGLGFGATNWDDFFNKIAEAFNTGNAGKPVFQQIKEDKTFNIPVWIKNTYSSSNNLQFPMSPNFIERITPDSLDKAKTLVIDVRYDKITQIVQAPSNGGGVMGGGMPDALDTGLGF